MTNYQSLKGTIITKEQIERPTTRFWIVSDCNYGGCLKAPERTIISNSRIFGALCYMAQENAKRNVSWVKETTLIGFIESVG